jgi:hypothetical protein
MSEDIGSVSLQVALLRLLPLLSALLLSGNDATFLYHSTIHFVAL